MPADPLHERKSVHQLAFRHYLRTGERLTNDEWLTRYERKFNPYHDERGRFTFSTGAAAGYDAGSRQTSARVGKRAGTSAPAPGLRDNAASPAGAESTPPSKPAESAGGFRSELVRNAVSVGGHADTYFELNKRQAGLDRLREAAGANPNPAVKADLDEIQKRLDADRGRLDDITRRVIDPETTEILRAGLAPADTVVGAVNVTTGKGELRDYLAVASVVPIGEGGKVVEEAAEPAAREIAQLGGAHWWVKKFKPKGYEAHHMPANSINGLRTGEGPAIAMLKEHHLDTLSHGNGPEANAYREIQKSLVRNGKFREAVEMDIKHIRDGHGTLYDDSIAQMIEYMDKKGY